MSKPRVKWWGYVRNILYAYPRISRDPAPSDEDQQERAAVDAASKETAALPDGPERLELIRLVFFARSCTLEGAALRMHLSYTTARRKQSDFLRCVGKHLGLR